VSIVGTLLEFISDTHKTPRPVKPDAGSGVFAPAPPLDSRPSKHSKQKSTKMRQIYGLNYFNREVTERELAVHSRFFAFPLTENDNEKALEIGDKPDLDRDVRSDNRKEKAKSVDEDQEGEDADTVRARQLKHLNLAQHLVLFSSGPKCDPANLPATAIPTFINVAATDECLTASNALIAISNICSMKHVRQSLLESNMLHRVANIIPQVAGPTAEIAGSLLFYYFSFDAEIEDRVYNAGGSHISANGLSESRLLQIISLKTLANLMPCADRLRVTETIMRIIHTFMKDAADPAAFDCDSYDREMALVYLPLLLSVSSFTNTHGTLLATDVFDLLAKTAIYCQKKSDAEIGHLVAQILLSFLQVLDSHVTQQIVAEDNFIFAFEKLLEIHEENVFQLCMHGICVMSGVKELTDNVCASEILTVVSHTLFSWDKLAPNVARDAAMYYSNVCQSTTASFLRELVEQEQIALSLMALIEKSSDVFQAQQVAARGLQNILSIDSNCVLLCDSVLSTLLSLVKVHHDLGAAQAIYNISCCTSCTESLRTHKVHLTVLELYTRTDNLEVRNTYLQIICQMFYVPECVNEVVLAGIVQKLSDTITGPESSLIWPTMVKIALNIVDNGQHMTERQRLQIVGLLKVVCVKSTPDEIIGKASVVLAYLSLTLEDFSEVDAVLRSILSLSSHELVTESASIVLYNLTCSETNASIVVQDSVYIIIMITIMRRQGVKAETQMNIAKAMRTLCSLEKCTELMMHSSSLSDLIVIALLNASREDIKVVCSQAFYNMLTHFGPREELLRKGELWWAITRICKNDSMEIRLAAAKALLDLSIDAENSDSMREQHVFSFVQELTVGADKGFVDICMKAVQNLASQFDAPFALFELTSLLLICVDAVARCDNVITIRGSLAVIVNICIQRTSGWDAAILESANVLPALQQSAEVWGADEECREYVASMLWNMTTSRLLVKNFALPSLNQIMNVVYQGYPSGKMCENLLGVFVNYVTVPGPEERTPNATVLEIDICYALIFDAFGVGPSGNAMHPAACRSFALTMLAYVVMEMDLEQLTSDIVIGIVMASLENEPDVENFKVVVHELSKSAKSAGYLLDSKIFDILLKQLQAVKTTNDKVFKYISCCIRNIAMHKDTIPRVVLTENLDKLVQLILDASSLEDVALDMSLMLFYAEEYMLKNEFVINSEFALESIKKIMVDWEDGSEISKICKYTLGEVLEKYSEGVYVDPAFVQSMYTEMNRGKTKEVLTLAQSLPPRALQISASFAQPNIKNKVGNVLGYFITTGAMNQWKPFLVRERKRMVTEMLDKSIVVPMNYKNLLNTATVAHNAWAKVEDMYPRLSLPSKAEITEFFDNANSSAEQKSSDNLHKQTSYKFKK